LLHRDQVRIFIFSDRRGIPLLAGRTLRAIAAAGLQAEDVCSLAPAALAQSLAAALSPVWLLRAGAWPVGPFPAAPPPSSASGLPLLGLGAITPASSGCVNECDDERDAWSRLLQQTGGDFTGIADLAEQLPSPASVYLEPPLVEALAARLARGEELTTAIRCESSAAGRRVVRLASLDVHFDPSLRIAQVVTSLQQGGAERIVLDLHRGLCERGCNSQVIVLGRPTRTAFPSPPGTVDVSGEPSRAQRVAAAGEAAVRFAADAIHAHLLDAADLAQLAPRNVPVVVTVHNARAGWPEGLASLEPDKAALLVACSQAVERDLQASGPSDPRTNYCRGAGCQPAQAGWNPAPRGGSHSSPGPAIPIRTVWNGIDFARFERTAERDAAGRAIRRRVGIRPEAFVLLALANPRPQKRLELLPAVLAATEAEFARRGIARPVHLVVAGEASRHSELAIGSQSAFDHAAETCGAAERIHCFGAACDVAAILAAADVLVSPSAYEGLSLSHLEALAAERPLVATAVGGTPEIAADNPSVFLLPPDAAPEEYARRIADVELRTLVASKLLKTGEAMRVVGQVSNLPGQDSILPHNADFTRYRMTEGYCRLYPRAIARAKRRPAPSGLWLVTNNFSTGGAQSSARRLLLGLASRGIRVRAAVLEEEPEHPTPGRRALAVAGIPVLALPPAGTIDPAEAIAILLERLDADRPEAVLLWNAITQHKVLLADALLDTPVHDVSPGEMYFSSLEKYLKRPRPGLPYRTARDYGARLASVIVKYEAEAALAAEWLGTRVHVVPNGVPVAPQWIAPPSRDRLVIGTAARISPQKKLEDLLLALRKANGRMPPHVLRIAGGVERGATEYAARLTELAEGLPVEWTGELDDTWPFLRGLDLFAMISEPAGCPNASLEAMAAGLPIVATDVGGAAEQIEDGVTGRLVPRGDIEALAEALLEQAWNPALRVRLAAAAHARAVERFHEDRMVEDYRRVLFGGRDEG
jgi:glycosyltransferase involved in cell wall biosynthesis